MKKIVRLTESDLIRLIRRVIKEEESSSDNFQRYQSFLKELFDKEFDMAYTIYENTGEPDEWFRDMNVSGEFLGSEKRKVKLLGAEIYVRGQMFKNNDKDPDFENERHIIELVVLYPTINLGEEYIVGLGTDLAIKNAWEINDMMKNYGLNVPVRFAIIDQDRESMDSFLTMSKIDDLNKFTTLSNGMQRGNRKIIDYAYKKFGTEKKRSPFNLI